MKPRKLTMMHFFIKTDHVESDTCQLEYKIFTVILRKLAMYKPNKHYSHYKEITTDKYDFQAWMNKLEA